MEARAASGSVWPKVAMVLAGLALVALLLHGEFARAFVAASRALERQVSGAGVAGAAAFFLFAALSVVLGPFSSAPLVPAAVLAWGRVPTMALLLGGWLLGNTAAYALGRYGMHPLLRRAESWRKLEEGMKRLPRSRSLAAGAVVRMTMPSEVGYAYGALRFDFRWYLGLTLLAEAPTAAVLVYASEALVNHDARQLVTWVLAGAGLTVAAWLVRGAWQAHQDGAPVLARRRWRRA